LAPESHRKHNLFQLYNYKSHRETAFLDVKAFYYDWEFNLIGLYLGLRWECFSHDNITYHGGFFFGVCDIFSILMAGINPKVYPVKLVFLFFFF